MKKTMTLAEAREQYGETTYEVETGFLVNRFGKYRPNITFIIPKTFDLGKDGKIIDPLKYAVDKEMTDNMNVDFDGDASFIFGDFWRSKKGGACFRPKDPRYAKHLLICVGWGGAFDKHRGCSREYAEKVGALYFRRASSNGGGCGSDYWVVPVGFKKSCYNPEFDGDTPMNTEQDFEVRARAYREKHAYLQKEAVEEADKFLKEKAASEEASRSAKAQYVGRLEEIQAELQALKHGEFGNYGVDQITLGEEYFKMGYHEYLYNEDSLAEAEKSLGHAKTWVVECESREKAAAEARTEFEPHFEALRPAIEENGWKLACDAKSAGVKNPARASVYSNGVTHYEYSQAGISSLRDELRAEKGRRAAAKAAEDLKAAQAEAEDMGLPSDVRIWHRSGATGAGKGWVITPQGVDRECDEVDTSMHKSNSKRYHQSYEGDHIWKQIMPGELVLQWRHDFTAAPHECTVIYQPDELTEAQIERVAEIQQELEEQFFGKAGLTGSRSCPPIGRGWGLF